MLGLIGAGGCRKDSHSTQSTPQATGTLTGNFRTVDPDADGEAITANVAQFYENMQDHRSAVDLSNLPKLSVNSTEFIIEAVYNRYAVEFSANDGHLTEERTFSFQTPLSGNSIPYNTVASAFWEVKDSLMVQYNAIASDNKKLVGFDLSVVQEGSSATFTFTSSIISGGQLPELIGEPCNQYVFPANKAYFFNYAFNGQGTWNNGFPITNITNGPDAPELLSSYLRKHVMCPRFEQPCGYWVNVGQTLYDALNAPVLTTPISDYDASGIPDYDNADMYRTFLRYNQFPYYLSDAFEVYKNWLNGDMMNFYYNRLVNNYLPSAIPLNKKFYFMQVLVVADPITSYSTGYGQPRRHQYKFLHGNFVRYCGPGGVTLPNL